MNPAPAEVVKNLKNVAGLHENALRGYLNLTRIKSLFKSMAKKHRYPSPRNFEISNFIDKIICPIFHHEHRPKY